MSSGTDTLFAKIARGDIPCAKVMETDRALAFLDINPVSQGHVLLIPKLVYPSVVDLPDDLAAHLGFLLPRICRAVKSATGAEALNIVCNDGSVAGQTIPHVHWHVIPRFADDAVRWPWPHSSYAEGQAEAVLARIVAALPLE